MAKVIRNFGRAENVDRDALAHIRAEKLRHTNTEAAAAFGPARQVRGPDDRIVHAAAANAGRQVLRRIHSWDAQ